MHPLDAVPAVRRIETDRENLVAIEIVGPLTGPDVENLYGLLEGAYTLHETIDLLVLASEDDDVDWSRVSDETIEESHDHARSHIRRCAVVGGSNGVASVLKAIGKTSRGEYRHFGADERDAALEWIGSA